MIRAAVPDDLPRLIEMGRAFFVEAGYEASDDWCVFCADSFEETARTLIHHGLLLVADKGGEVVGMAGSDAARAFWNREVVLAREAFWYIMPAHRQGLGRELLKALETMLASRGARVFDVVAETGKRSAALARIYLAAGYSPAEHTFRKRL